MLTQDATFAGEDARVLCCEPSTDDAYIHEYSRAAVDVVKSVSRQLRTAPRYVVENKPEHSVYTQRHLE